MEGLPYRVSKAGFTSGRSNMSGGDTCERSWMFIFCYVFVESNCVSNPHTQPGGSPGQAMCLIPGAALCAY